ncbi:MAG: DUF1249 domain-containing protein [Saccharospirillaceae bacterium]|nr:DUF1249 domain-containing protein [Saccharospirillaceae bacterium]MCD8530789.1 DUF1249 domain-containing protein [Saccharospirillaceae bacterium]
MLKKRQRYVPDLQEMAALCEANYLRLLKLLNGAEVGEMRAFRLSDDLHCALVRLCVDEDHRYTTMVSVTQEGLSPDWLQPLSMQVRLYHDASMAEVLSYQNQQRFDGRYSYPNPAMRMPDEKVQLNRFLAEWLGHCLQYGQTIQPIVLPDIILPVR